jgi:hypothetical protein
MAARSQPDENRVINFYRRSVLPAFAHGDQRRALTFNEMSGGCLRSMRQRIRQAVATLAHRSADEV